MLGLLRQDETAWDFELKGSRRSDHVSHPFLSVYDGFALPYRHAVRRGRWIPGAIRQFGALGMTFDCSNRSTNLRFMLYGRNPKCAASLAKRGAS